MEDPRENESILGQWPFILVIIGAIALALATSNGQHQPAPMVDNTQPNSYTITSSFNDNSVNVCLFYCPEGSR